jgi:Bax protein
LFQDYPDAKSMRRSNSVFCLILLTGLISCECNDYVYRLDVTLVDNHTVEDLIPINDSLVEPVIYQQLAVDKEASPQQRKEQFIAQVLPAILITQYYMEKRLERIDGIIRKIELNEPVDLEDQSFIDSLKIRYHANDYNNLKARLKPHAASLVLAQAALESGWGQSRIAGIANNLFGITTFENDSNAIESKDGTAPVYMKRYDTIIESVEHYFLILGRHKAYKGFRKKREGEATVYQLIDQLNRYSELGEGYGRLLKRIIKANKLEQYDHYRIRETAEKNCWYYKLKNKYFSR